MRRHIDYYYKCYDRNYLNEQDRIFNECFNDYGYNFDTNKRKATDPDEYAKKISFKNYQNKIESKK